MTIKLVMQALFRGVSTKRLAKGLILDSGRGSQYSALDCQKLLEQFGMTCIHVSQGGLLG